MGSRFDTFNAPHNIMNIQKALWSVTTVSQEAIVDVVIKKYN